MRVDSLWSSAVDTVLLRLAPVPLVDLRSSKEAPIHYFRLEHHPDAPGPIFGEPALHLHVMGNGVPRTPVEIGPAENPLLWFLEFLTFNYDYDAWAFWFEAIADGIGLHTAFSSLSSAYRTATIHTTGRNLYPDLRRIISAAIDIKSKAVRDTRMRLPEPLDHSLGYRFG